MYLTDIYAICTKFCRRVYMYTVLIGVSACLNAGVYLFSAVRIRASSRAQSLITTTIHSFVVRHHVYK